MVVGRITAFAAVVAISGVEVMGHRGRVMRTSDLLNRGLETVFRVGRILDQPDRAVRFHQAVVAAHRVPVPFLVLFFYVAGLRVVDSVLEAVSRIRIMIMVVFWCVIISF